MPFYDDSDIDYINSRIASIRDVLNRVDKLGQEHSSDSAGSSRSVKEVEYDSLNKELAKLMRAKREITGCGGGSVAGSN